MNLPKPTLSREKAWELWKTEHSEYAKEQIILSNQGLVANAMKSLNIELFDDDMFMTGLYALCKAVNTFDFDKGFKFSTYAAMVIRNEYLMIFRKKRIQPTNSLDEPIIFDNNEARFGDIIPSDVNIENEVVSKEILSKFLETLTEREKQVIELSMRDIGQIETGRIIGISQSQVSKILKKVYQKYLKFIW